MQSLRKDPRYRQLVPSKSTVTSTNESLDIVGL
jgi:hypothetical protein